MAGEDDLVLELEAVEADPPEYGVEPVWLRTTGGTIHTRYHCREAVAQALLTWLRDVASRT